MQITSKFFNASDSNDDGNQSFLVQQDCGKADHEDQHYNSELQTDSHITAHELNVTFNSEAAQIKDTHKLGSVNPSPVCKSSKENNNFEKGDPRQENLDHQSEIVGDSNIAAKTENYRYNSGPGKMGLTQNLRFLNVAALYKRSGRDVHDERKHGKLCTVKEVEEAKKFVKVLRLSSVFCMYGVMTAVGDTFFMEQANKMDTYIFSFEVPIAVFALSSDFTRKLVSKLCQWKLAKRGKTLPNTFHGTLRVGFGMLLSIPCFLIAFYFEAKRRKALEKEETMSAYLLTPQILLMGVMDGLAVDGIGDFFKREMPASIGISYGTLLAEAMTGIGQLVGIVWFSLWNLMPGLFGDDIDSSHLDKYYLIMVGFGFVSCITYGVVASIHARSCSNSSSCTSSAIPTA